MGRISASQELMNLHRDADIISETRKRKLRWLEHVETTPEKTTVKVFKNTPQRKRSLERPRKRWL